MMPEWVEEYHRLSGDTGLVAELLPQLQDTAEYVLRPIPLDGPTAGLVTDLGGGGGPYLHGIVDWPAPGRFGYDMDCAARTTGERPVMVSARRRQPAMRGGRP
jgi:alpha-L-rhamnosidase